MIDDLDGDAAALRPGEGAGGIAVQAFPGVLVDLGLEGDFQGLVGIFGAQEVGSPVPEDLNNGRYPLIFLPGYGRERHRY